MIRSRFAVAMLLVVSLAPSSYSQLAAVPKASLPQHERKASGTSSQDFVLRMDVLRVPLDVVVTDKQGNPVRGLKKDDFIIKEDKKLQHALTFEYSDGSVPSFVPSKPSALPANTFVNIPGQPERGPLYVLYYDMVNTSMNDQLTFHKQLLEFVDKAQPGTRIAIFLNSSKLSMLQGFTSDHTLLRTALLTKGPGPHMPNVFLYGDVYGFLDVGAALSNLNFLAECLGGIPGRKNLIWMSSAFPIPVGPVQMGHGPTDSSQSTMRSEGFQRGDLEDLTVLEAEGIKRTYSALMRSQIALYPVDLSGVVVDGGDALVNHDYLDTIAAATGGQAFYSNNRINELLDKAVADGETYYSLSYSPTNTKYDGSERKIEVRLARKGDYKLTYRRLYYAVSGDEVQAIHKKDTLQARFIASKTADTLYANIEHGAPMLHDLLFSAHIATEGKPAMATAEQMTQLEDSPAFFRKRKKDRPLKPLAPVELQRFMIDYGVLDPQLKTLATHKQGPPVLEFAAAAYDADGRLLNSVLNEGLASTASNPDGKSGILFHAEQELEAPPGAAWIRLAVRDKLNDRTGTLEVRLPLANEGKVN